MTKKKNGIQEFPLAADELDELSNGEGSADSPEPEVVRKVSIELPLGEPPASGYEREQADAGNVSIGGPDRLHVNAQLGPAAAQAFLQLRAGLRESRACMADGRPVWTNADALRWFLEQVAGTT
jgi:hypothetical protein